MRRACFAAAGATLDRPRPPDRAPPPISPAPRPKRLFAQIVARRLSAPADAELFRAQMLTEMARMSLDDGLVMQIHPARSAITTAGCFTRVRPRQGRRYPDAHRLRARAEAAARTASATSAISPIIVFTLDETAYARELAPLAGHYPVLKLGPAWWFHDSPEGMRRFREQTTETAGFYNTVGFNDDTARVPVDPGASRRRARASTARSSPGWCAEHRLDGDDAHQIARDLAYHLPKRAYQASINLQGREAPLRFLSGAEVMRIKVLQATHPEMIKSLDTTQLREVYLAQRDLRSPVRSASPIVMSRRFIIGGAHPVKRRDLKLTTMKRGGLRSFLARREMGVINIGGAGRVSIDGSNHGSKPRDVPVYRCRQRQCRRSSRRMQRIRRGSTPASSPSHARHPTVRDSRVRSQPMPMGAVGDLQSNARSTNTSNPRHLQVLPAPARAHFTQEGQRLEHHALSPPRPALGGLLLLRPQAGRSCILTSWGSRMRRATSSDGERAGGDFATVVDSLGRGTSSYSFICGDGRRQPGLQGHGPGTDHRPALMNGSDTRLVDLDQRTYRDRDWCQYWSRPGDRHRACAGGERISSAVGRSRPDDTAKHVRAAGRAFHAIECGSERDAGHLGAVVKEVIDKLGHIDVLVNNAGTIRRNAALELPPRKTGTRS